MFCLICGKGENNANFVVWQQICQECKAEFWMIPTVNGELDMDTARQMLSDKVKLLAVTAVSNVTGAVVDIETLIAWAKIYDIPVYIDAAQAVRHRMFDLEKMQCDFLGFSAHKMMGPTGVGCLFVRKTLLDQMYPYRYGGGMIDIVTEAKTTFAKLPERLGAGTPNYSGIIAWGAAIDYLTDIGIEILGYSKQRAGCISFQINEVHPYDFASMIDKYGVAVRTGSMCAQPIVKKLGLDTVIRISPAFYNTVDEIEKFGEYTEKVITFFERIKR